MHARPGSTVKVRVSATTAFLVFLLVGVASAGERSTGWWEVQTEHVNLRTDLSADDALTAALTVERDRSALLAAAWGSAKLLQPERIDVVVFAQKQDFARYFPPRVAGLLRYGQYPPTAFLFGPADTWDRHFSLQDGAGLDIAFEETDSVLKHELTHYLSAYIYPREPTWFSEGLAQYLATLRRSKDGNMATLGEVNLTAMQYYRNDHGKVRVKDVLAWDAQNDAKSESRVNGLYGLSWLLVHWLNNTHPEAFARFQTYLMKGIDPGKAWKAAFPTLLLSDLDTTLKRYAESGTYHVVDLPIPAVGERANRQPMTSANVHATRASAALAGGTTRENGTEQEAEALLEIKAALDEDSGNVRALGLKLGLVPPTERPALGRRASQAHPEDGLAWLALAEALGSSPESWEERAGAYQKATALVPDNPTAFNSLAWMYVQAGRAQDALPLAVTAARMAPWNSAVLDTLAAALFGVGRCTEAFAAQTRALDALPEAEGSARRRAYAARLAEIQQTCTEGSSSQSTSVPTP
jgi:tetratricopeptide (TPR) repeat protein